MILLLYTPEERPNADIHRNLWALRRRDDVEGEAMKNPLSLAKAAIRRGEKAENKSEAIAELEIAILRIKQAIRDLRGGVS